MKICIHKTIDIVIKSSTMSLINSTSNNLDISNTFCKTTTKCLLGSPLIKEFKFLLVHVPEKSRVPSMSKKMMLKF